MQKKAEKEKDGNILLKPEQKSRSANSLVGTENDVFLVALEISRCHTPQNERQQEISGGVEKNATLLPSRYF